MSIQASFSLLVGMAGVPPPTPTSQKVAHPPPQKFYLPAKGSLTPTK